MSFGNRFAGYGRRLAFCGLLLLAMFLAGVPPAVIALFAALMAFSLVLRSRIQREIESQVERCAPFTKDWPSWARWALVFVLVVIAYYAVKLVAFYFLGLAGIDISGQMLEAFNKTA